DSMNMKLKIAIASVAVISASALTGCGAGDNSESGHRQVSASMNKAVSMNKADRTMADATPIHVVLALNLEDRAGLDQFIEELHTPGHANFRKFLAPSEVARRFGPSQGHIN